MLFVPNHLYRQVGNHYISSIKITKTKTFEPLSSVILFPIFVAASLISEFLINGNQVVREHKIMQRAIQPCLLVVPTVISDFQILGSLLQKYFCVTQIREILQVK